MLIPPYIARAAGKRKIPDPVMFPTTSEVLIQNPILRVSLLVFPGWLI
jgi:hypothetical protein